MFAAYVLVKAPFISLKEETAEQFLVLKMNSSWWTPALYTKGVIGYLN